ncbi:MAG: hypothetical protein KKC79_19875 [Gammaproteobacteria bacterium]|nr:hypothetical protein [Gammaproteobacteria bacterium]MBU1443288.1 hypothetical protein [Gammaproteobacteria bacterium]MBU2285093.1 hypothetical protein [Gammaproteobacteria bacterium]MBU2410895.1 hypothetical protein [Gammaproteobacteria bacterium]
MHRDIPEASISLTILVIYIGFICVVALAGLLFRWWLQHRDPLHFQRRSYSQRLGDRFDRKRARLRRTARKAARQRQR